MNGRQLISQGLNGMDRAGLDNLPLNVNRPPLS
jgi:hypothetical protein